MRLQLALNVTNLDESIAFYEKMFATPVAKVKPGYANFVIENPPLKLALFEGAGPGGSINHLGVEVETAEQVTAAEDRIRAEGIETTGVSATECCYAEKTETWVSSPDNRWEWYVKTGDNEQFENVTVNTGQTTCCPEPAAGDVRAPGSACC